MIKALLIILLLIGCAADEKYTERWIASLETLPRMEGYVVTGIFELGKNLYAQHCDSKEYEERISRLEQGAFWPTEEQKMHMEEHGPGPDEEK